MKFGHILETNNNNDSIGKNSPRNINGSVDFSDKKRTRSVILDDKGTNNIKIALTYIIILQFSKKFFFSCLFIYLEIILQSLI